MKKDRNAFFQEASFYNQAMAPNMMAANQPFVTNAQAQQSFYAGAMPNNYNMPVTQMPNNMNNFDTSDIESRLSKLERSINRIDARLSKLENQNIFTTEDIDVSTNMYMV